jgi:hypothetical protein
MARNMQADERRRLEAEGVTFYDNPQKLLANIADAFCKAENS